MSFDRKGMIAINAQLKGSMYLVACSMVWGMAFVAQGSAMEHVQPATFVCVRFFITFAVLAALSPVIGRITGRGGAKRPPLRRHLAVGGLIGAVLGLASILQQLGLVHTSPTNSGFVTALYIVIVPLMGLALGQRVGPQVWVGVLVSLIGLWLLCVSGRLQVNPGDLITLGCALVFAVHITLVDRLAGNLDTVLLSAIQFGAGALVALVLMLCFETPSWSGLRACLPSLLYAALVSGALGYTLQLFGQKYTAPALASLIMCLESVFAAVGEWLATRLGLYAGHVLGPRQLIGCGLMLAASVIAQLPARRRTQ